MGGKTVLIFQIIPLYGSCIIALFYDNQYLKVLVVI